MKNGFNCKIISSWLLVLIIFVSIFAPINQAKALPLFPGGAVIIAADVGPDVNDRLMEIANGIAFIAKKAIIAAVRATLVQFVQEGNIEQGAGSLLVTNFKQHLLNELDAEFAGYISEVTNTDICSPFKFTIESLLKLNYPRYNILQNRASCTVSRALAAQGRELDDFYSDFRNGSWDTWIEHNKPQNTPLGALSAAEEDWENREALREQGASTEAEAGDGYIGAKICVKWLESPDGSQERCAEHDIVTPGNLVGDQVARYFGADLDNFIQADTWKEFLIGLSGLLIARLLDVTLANTLGGLAQGDPTQLNDGPAEGGGGEGGICEVQSDCGTGLLCSELPYDTDDDANLYCQRALQAGDVCQTASQGVPTSLGQCASGLGCYPSATAPGLYECAQNPGEAGLGDACSTATYNVPFRLQCNRSEGLVCKEYDLGSQILRLCAKQEGESCSDDGDCYSGTCTFNVCQP